MILAYIRYIYIYIYIIRSAFYVFFSVKGEGGGELSLRFSVFLLQGLFMCFTVMNEYSLDEPGFTPPVPPVCPSSSESSVDAPVDGRRKCSSCPRRMSKKSADRHTVCVSCRGFDCDIDCRCDECLEWSEEEILEYAKYRKSLKSRESSSRKTTLPTPPLTTSGPSPQPAPLPAQQPALLPAQPPAPRTVMIFSPKWTPSLVIFNLCQRRLRLSCVTLCLCLVVNPSRPVSPG